MHIRPLTERYAVSPQISPDDLPAIKAAGYTTVICNRPDPEVPDEVQSLAMRQAAEAVGLAFVVNPITPGMMEEDTVAAQRDALAAASGPVLAYCGSGTRSTVAWMFGAAADTPPETLLSAARAQGYDLDGLRPQLDALHRG